METHPNSLSAQVFPAGAARLGLAVVQSAAAASVPVPACMRMAGMRTCAAIFGGVSSQGTYAAQLCDWSRDSACCILVMLTQMQIRHRCHTYMSTVSEVPSAPVCRLYIRLPTDDKSDERSRQRSCHRCCPVPCTLTTVHCAPMPPSLQRLHYHSNSRTLCRQESIGLRRSATRHGRAHRDHTP